MAFKCYNVDTLIRLNREYQITIRGLLKKVDILNKRIEQKDKMIKKIDKQLTKTEREYNKLKKKESEKYYDVQQERN